MRLYQSIQHLSLFNSPVLKLLKNACHSVSFCFSCVCVHVLSMGCSGAVHGLFRCCPCAVHGCLGGVHGLSMCYPCTICVLSMCYPCAVPVLSVCSQCALHVLSMCFPCAVPVLSICCPYAVCVFSVCYPYARYVLSMYCLCAVHNVLSTFTHMN